MWKDTTAGGQVRVPMLAKASMAGCIYVWGKCGCSKGIKIASAEKVLNFALVSWHRS